MCDYESDTKHEEGNAQRIDSCAEEQNDNTNLNESESQSGRPDQNQPAEPLSEGISSQIFKMDIDSFEELFDYLSVYDILALRLTCKRFKKIIDFYLRTNYPRLQNFRLQPRNVRMFRRMDADTIELIKKMYVMANDYLDWTKFPKGSRQKVLDKVKQIEVCSWQTYPDFYHYCLKYCNNVKWLSIKRNNRYNSRIQMNNEWLSRQYASIEYLCIDYIWKQEVDLYVKFFHLNPNIHALSIQLESVNEIGSDLLAAGIHFDRLYIDATNRWSISEKDVVTLESLYDAGFYKRLCLTSPPMDPSNEGTQSKFASIGLEVLSVQSLNCTIPAIPSLKELNIDARCDFNDKYANVRNVIERLSCDITYSNVILAFVGYFPKLKHFQIQKMNDAYKLNLLELNKERENLPGACKTTIYINEKVFLTTKWANMKTNYNLIELKRVHACDWNQFFENECGICGP